jgi:hypothetical protein
MERNENWVEHSERAALRAVERGELRCVCAKRKRKLRRKGVRVFWSAYFASWAWNPLAALATSANLKEPQQ